MRSSSFVALVVVSCAVCSSGFTAKRLLRPLLLYPAHNSPTSSHLEQISAASRLQKHPLWQPERTFEPAAKRVDGAKRSNFETFSRELREQPTLLRQHALAITAVVCSAVFLSSFFVASLPSSVAQKFSVLAPSVKDGLKLLTVGVLFQSWPSRPGRKPARTKMAAKPSAPTPVGAPTILNPAVRNSAASGAFFRRMGSAASGEWNDYGVPNPEKYHITITEGL